MAYVVVICIVDIDLSMEKIQTSDFNVLDETHNSRLLCALSVLFHTKIKLDSYSHQ